MPRPFFVRWVSPLACILIWALWLGPPPGAAWAGQAPPAEAPAASQTLVMGLLPVAVPSGPVGEAMRRDQVLARGLAELGMTVTYRRFLKGPDGNRLMEENQLDGLMAGDLPTLAAAGRTPVVVATLLFQGFSALVASRPMPLGSIDGHVIGYARGSVAHYGLFKALDQAGYGSGNVTLVAMDANEMLAALTKGRVDMVAVWEPYVTMLLNRFPQATVLHRTLYHGYLYFTRQAVERHPRTVRLLIAAQIRAMAWMREKRANLLAASRWALEAQRELSGQELDIGPEQYAALVRGDLLDTAPTPEVPAGEEAPGGDLEARFNFLKSQGMIPQDAQFSAVREMFDRSMVREVLADPARYGLDQFDYQD